MTFNIQAREYRWLRFIKLLTSSTYMKIYWLDHQTIVATTTTDPPVKKISSFLIVKIGLATFLSSSLSQTYFHFKKF